MVLAYISRTKNIETIVERLNLSKERVVNVRDYIDKCLEEDFCLLTYTDVLGAIPEEVEKFLLKNNKRLKAVAGSGNRNFGSNFCGAAVKIHERYGVPLLATFELSGDEISIEEFKKKLNEYNG